MPEVLRAGPASMTGLRWLAAVGPSPMDAWACAMGWGLRTAQSHSQRLESEGWLKRYAMTRGHGSLLVATDRGIRVAELALSARAPPDADLVGPRLRVRVDGGMADRPPRRLARPARGPRRSRIEPASSSGRPGPDGAGRPIDPTSRSRSLTARWWSRWSCSARTPSALPRSCRCTAAGWTNPGSPGSSTCAEASTSPTESASSASRPACLRRRHGSSCSTRSATQTTRVAA